MKRLFAVLALVLLLVGCEDRVYGWDFAYGTEAVAEIKIIEASGDFTYSVIEELDLDCVRELYADLESLEMKKVETI